MKKFSSYIETNKQRFLDELFDFIRIPSVSARPEHKGDMQRAAIYVKDALMEAGTDNSSVILTKGHPIVYGEKIIDPRLPTVLIYGHYDVQPSEPLELWKSPPFEPEIRDNKIYARGADDDKGQLYIQLKAFEQLCRTNMLPCNVKFLIEGEEEIGSPNLRNFCLDNIDQLKCDIVLVSDTSMISIDIPSITVGLRGLCYFEVEITGPNRDLHSGAYGGAVANPINVLAKMIALLTNEHHQVTVPGFYNKVITVSQAEQAAMEMVPFDLATFKNDIGVNDIMGEEGYSTLERVGSRPCIDVNGIWGGYTGDGAKTIIPSSAHAKISMRLVPDQDPAEIEKTFEEYFRSIAPKAVTVKVKRMQSGKGFVSPVDTPAYRAASKAIENTFGKTPVPTRRGGSIPVITDFEDILGVKSILLGFGLESDAIHAPNENFPLFNFFKGIETVPLFYKYFSELHSGNSIK